jgi:hypothetical protein
MNLDRIRLSGSDKVTAVIGLPEKLQENKR